MTNSVKIITLISILVTVLFLLFFSMSYKKMSEFENKSNFECGFNSKNKYNTSFSLNYFFLTIILIVFDLEMLLIFLSVNYEFTAMKIMIVVSFMSIFSLLLSYEWLNSALEWE